VGERDVALHLRVDGLRVVVVEDQPVDVAGKVFYVAGQVRLGSEILAAKSIDVHAALVDQSVAGRVRKAVGGGGG
jgi:hypothetical protein